MTEKFTGKERDAESGLDYFGARYYGSALGRWTSPDRINLTRLRLSNPTNTLNKYVYAANNPFKFVDRDGEDITIFYRPSSGLAAPSTGNYGHIFLGALNQATGKAGFLDFYPAGGLNGGKGPGAFNQGDMKDRAAQSSQFATLTIQTTPEEAQKVLDLINKLKSGDAPDYAVFSSNCTTVCETVLHDLGLDFGDISPDAFFNDAFTSYGAAFPGSYDNLIQNRVTSFMPGREYGNPRNVGMDFTKFLFQLYFNQQNEKPVKACVSASDDKGNTTGTTCN